MFGIGALLVTAFAGIMGIQSGLSNPKKQLSVCRVELAKYDLIQQCPVNSMVVYQGKKLGKWDGVELKK